MRAYGKIDYMETPEGAFFYTYYQKPGCKTWWLVSRHPYEEDAIRALELKCIRDDIHHMTIQAGAYLCGTREEGQIIAQFG